MEAASTFQDSKHGLINSPKNKARPGMVAGIAPSSRALHDTSFFIDFDIDDSGSETGESFDDCSPVHSSVESFSEHSQTTASPSDVNTPDPQAEDAPPNPIFRLKSVRGPGKQDGHFFRATLASAQDFDWRSFEPEPPDEPVPTIPVRFQSAQAPHPNSIKPVHQPNKFQDSASAQFGLDLDDLLESETAQPALGLPEFMGGAPAQLNDVEVPLGTTAVDAGDREERSDVHTWSTQQVAAWMYNSGFENSIISTFKTHDINGAILFQLEFEDLRELDILSFGKRKQIWNEINALRNEGSPDPLRASTVESERGCSDIANSNSSTERARKHGFERNGTVTGYRRPSCSNRTQVPHVHQSVEVPRPHRCSKGERCPKWRQYQRIIAKLDREHGPNTPPSGGFSVAAPRTSPSIPQTLQTMNETVSAKPSALKARPANPTPPRSYLQQFDAGLVLSDESLEASDSPTLEPRSTHPAAIDTQHIVQQYQKSGSANTLTPDTPKWDLFPTTPGSRVSSYPIRESSLLGAMPNIAATLPTSTHSPSSSGSTVRHGDKGTSASPDMSQSEKLVHHIAAPELLARPLSPASSTITRDSSATLVAATGSPSMEPVGVPKYDLRPPPPDSDVPMTALKPSFQTEVRALSLYPPPDPSEHPAFRTGVPTERRSPSPRDHQRATPRNRGVSPASRSTEPPTRPLPNIPQKPATAEHRSPPASASASAPSHTVVADMPEQVPTLRAGVMSMPHSTSPPPQGVAANFSRQVRSPPPPRSAASSPPLRSTASVLSQNSIASVTSSSSNPSTAPFSLPTSNPANTSTVSRTSNPSTGSILSRTSNPSTSSTASRTSNPSAASIASRTSNPSHPPSVASIPATPRTASPSLAADCYGPEMLQVGWVRQRRVRLWRNEWTPVHLRLNKTQMSIHATAKLDDLPLEVIKMDEYEVGVTTGGMEGNHKIASAIKNWRPGNSSKGSGSSTGSMDDAFGFQLVPTSELVEAFHNSVRGSAALSRPGIREETKTHHGMIEGRPSSASSSSTTSTGSGKDDANAKQPRSYYFAVKTRDDRIEWMRNVMIATAHMSKSQQEQRLTTTEERSSGEGRISLDDLLFHEN